MADEPGTSMLVEDQMCFALYAASRAVTALYRPLLDELGLTYPQYLVLLVLWAEGPSQVKDIGAALALDYGTLSPLIKRLEKAGLVSRQRRADDERSVQVVLTDEGVALREKARAVPPVIAAAMNLPPARFDDLRAGLRQLTDSVIAHTGELGG
ncbi:MAG TPA: MarR family transcriptional regulator [Pseudonocardiaceae bacterium]|jgi:DNA-binding MarR family transcriptional regulator